MNSQPPARDAYFDNARFLAVILVVAGHAWEPLRDHRPVEAAHLFVYAFHLPVFVLLAGHLGRGFARSRDRTRRLVTGLVVPYVTFDAAYALFAAVAGGRRLAWTPLEPYYLTWFLLALAIWRLTVPLWDRLRAPLLVAVLVSLVAGATATPSALAADRVAALLPFFVLGLRLRPVHLAALRRPPVRAVAAAVLAAALGGAYALAGRLDAEWLHWREGYGTLVRDLPRPDLPVPGVLAPGLPVLAGVGLWLAVLAVAGTLAAAFLALVPARRTWFTRFGTATLHAYLLHGFVVHGAVYAGWYEPARGPAGAAAVALLAVGLTFALVSRPVRAAAGWAVAPRLDRLWRPGPRVPAARWSATRTPGRSGAVTAGPRRDGLPAARATRR